MAMKFKREKDFATKNKVAAKKIADKRLVPTLLEVEETKAAKAIAKHAKTAVKLVKVKKAKKAAWAKTPKTIHKGKPSVNNSAGVIKKAMERVEKAKAAGVHGLPKNPIPYVPKVHKKKKKEPAKKPKKVVKKAPKPAPKPISKSHCKPAVTCKKKSSGCLAARANELQCKATEARHVAYKKH